MPVVLVKDSKNILTNCRPGAKIELIKLPTGEFIVTWGRKTKEEIIIEKYLHLIDQPITVTEASEKYHVPRPTIQRWKDKGYLKVLDPGYQAKLNEADVAYCVDIYRGKKEEGTLYGRPLLDEKGLPYEMKRPKLSDYRRQKKSP